MSLAEIHHKLTAQNGSELELIIARMVAEALRTDYGQQYSSIKQIAKHADASISTIRKWYDGQNPPNSRNLIMLARHSPSVMQILLILIGRWEEWELYRRAFAASKSRENENLSSRYSEKSFGINVRIDYALASQFNVRQLWFLGLVQQGHKPKANHIALAWKVSVRAGEGDIAGLMKARQIRFAGAKKTGHYRLF